MSDLQKRVERLEESHETDFIHIATVNADGTYNFNGQTYTPDEFDALVKQLGEKYGEHPVIVIDF